MITYTPIESCSETIFSYLTLNELFHYAYKKMLSNKMVHQGILYNIHKYKTNSLIYQKILSQKYSEKFISKTPIYCLTSYNPKLSFNEYVHNLMLKNKDLPQNMFFLINKMYKVFFIQEIDEENCLFISESFITDIYYTFIKQKKFETTKRFTYTNKHGYLYKDKKVTKDTNEIVSLLKEE